MRKIFLFLIVLTTGRVFAESATDIWSPSAKAVCEQINSASSLYHAGNLKNAHLSAVMAYFNGYDAHIEPAARITMGGPHVFEVERQFRDFAAATALPPDKNQLKKVSVLADALCKTVSNDAKALNEANVPRQVFKVDP